MYQEKKTSDLTEVKTPWVPLVDDLRNYERIPSQHYLAQLLVAN